MKATFNNSHAEIGMFNRSVKNDKSISSISISIASPEEIKNWSSGAIKKSETISYRTYKPEPEGLFSAKIFGPVRDYECQCGKYRRIKYRGITCERCGVEVTSSSVRRERMAHIELAAPVVNVLFLKGINSPISILLGITVKNLEKVLYFEKYIVTDPGSTSLNKCDLLTEKQYEDCLDEFGDSFKAGMGAEALREVLSSINFEVEKERLETLISETKSDFKLKSLVKKLHLVNDFISSGNRPEWMILTILPVLPPDLRPLVQLDGGRFVSSDLNELYRRVINRSERLKKMLAVKAPDVIVNNEKRMLQESVDALFDNSKRSSPSKSSSGRPLKALSDYLRGKYGRFRQNLLGKRVDYSGRSVIMVGPSLELHQCGLPKIMALELFKPFVFAKLILFGKANSVKMAKKIVEDRDPCIWDILESITKDHLVLLNRAPTLHRLNIQAFKPKLIDSKAIQLHPLVCKAFNADFDGDQMAVHVPLSLEAQMESWVLMLSSRNVLSPQNGQPVIVPTKDIVVGLYYITAPVKNVERNFVFDCYDDILKAIDSKSIKINSEIEYRYSYKDHADPEVAKVVHKAKTTAGSVMLFNFLPQDGKITFEETNKPMNSKEIASLLSLIGKVYGQGEIVKFSNKIVPVGFQHSKTSGISFGKDDMVIPETKEGHVEKSLSKIKAIEEQYSKGYITFREKYNQATDRWSECTNLVAKDMMEKLAQDKDNDKVNSIYVMMLSGARVSEPVMRQVAGMRGLIAKPSGEIIETPIISNFKEGLTVLEYFNSAHGARKGAADTALKTADAGYLTRRLVDVARDCVVQGYDCGVKNKGILMEAVTEAGKVVEKLSSVINGRVLSKDVVNIKNEAILKAGDVITVENAMILDEHEITSAEVRSPVMCKLENGICSSCYGLDLSTGNMVNEGEAVGVIAAQSIGEPGAQLTMRTFHIGGAASVNVEQSNVLADFEGTVELLNCDTVVDKEGKVIVVNYHTVAEVISEKLSKKKSYSIPYGSILSVKSGDKVKAQQEICSWDPYNSYMYAEVDGTVDFLDFELGVSCYEKVDEVNNVSHKIVKNWTLINKGLTPRAIIRDSAGNAVRCANGIGVAKYLLPVESIILVNQGEQVKAGDPIFRMPRESSQAIKDITGGLPRVEDIFEARVPKESAIIAENDGYLEFSSESKSKNKVMIKSDSNEELFSYNIAKSKTILFSEGSFVKKGQVIVDGNFNIHDILHVEGVAKLAEYMIEEVQKVYRLQGVSINNKHIEIIIRYMLRKVEITDSGDSGYIVGQSIDTDELKLKNDALLKDGKQPAEFNVILQGITRASIQTNSFISAASFQETTRVLSGAALKGKVDNLTGMKENIILGQLIPAGTGYIMSKLKNEAIKQQEEAASASE